MKPDIKKLSEGTLAEVLNNIKVKILEGNYPIAVEILEQVLSREQSSEIAQEKSAQDNNLEFSSDFDKYYSLLRDPKRASHPNTGEKTEAKIIEEFYKYGINVEDYKINIDDYRKYFDDAGYEIKYPNYYSSTQAEKSLEHFVAADLLNLQGEDVFIDIASQDSPVPEIYNRLYGVKAYKQDLSYPPGLNNDSIGGDASNMAIPDAFVSKMTLHCSLEHFEGLSDINFIKEGNRVLKNGGSICILPLYLTDEYGIVTDPKVAVQENVVFEEDAIIYAFKDWGNRHGRFYDVKNLKKRILDNLDGMDFKVYRIINKSDISKSCYLTFVLLITKRIDTNLP
jgi:hypothetical protein